MFRGIAWKFVGKKNNHSNEKQYEIDMVFCWKGKTLKS